MPAEAGVMSDKLVVRDSLSYRLTHLERRILSSDRFPRADTNENRRAREKEEKERHATTRLFSQRNIAPASECVRNRTDRNEWNKKKGEKKTESRCHRVELTRRYCHPRDRSYAACTL